jgi:hypothetical protein
VSAPGVAPRGPRRERVAALVVAAILPSAAGAAPDACHLLSDDDVRTLHGQTVSERVPSAPPARRFHVSQCVYRTAGLVQSVSLAVTAPRAPAPAGTVRAYWKERFSPPAAASRAKDPPRPVAGLGDEAFWVGDRLSGALYVLADDVFVRVSVGGIGEEGPRLERTKALAARVVERLAPR